MVQLSIQSPKCKSPLVALASLWRILITYILHSALKVWKCFHVHYSYATNISWGPAICLGLSRQSFSFSPPNSWERWVYSDLQGREKAQDNRRRYPRSQSEEVTAGFTLSSFHRSSSRWPSKPHLFLLPWAPWKGKAFLLWTGRQSMFQAGPDPRPRPLACSTTLATKNGRFLPKSWGRSKVQQGGRRRGRLLSADTLAEGGESASSS